MSRGMVYLRPFRVVYVRETGPYASSIQSAWERMLHWLDVNGLHSPVGRGFGLARDNPATVGPDRCRYDACVELDPIFEGRAARELALQTLPGGPYLRQRKTGDYARLTGILANLHETFEAPEGLRLDDRRPLVTMYLDDPRRFAPDDLRADLCIPIATKAGRTRGQGLEAA